MEDTVRPVGPLGRTPFFMPNPSLIRQPGPVSLRGLLPGASFVGCADIAVSAVTEHSGDCTPGCLFAALPGTRSHGRNHIAHALLGGAASILSDRPLADVSLPQCIVPDVRQAYGRICQGLFGFPSRKLGVAAVTGTNGKSTVTWIVRSLLESVSHPTGVIGTIEYNDGLISQPSTLTTPDALTLARWLAAMRDRHTPYAAIELSSHALKQERAAGVAIDVGVITNVTHDHLDYHKNRADYLRSKAKIAGLLKRGGLLALNADDPAHTEILEHIPGDCRVTTFGCDSPADVRGELQSVTSEGTRFRLACGVERIDCFTPLIGKHNVSNSLAAVAAARHFGLTMEQIARGLAETAAVPGRLQRIDGGRDFEVFVDYAHTDDALRRVIHTLRNLTAGRLIVVFGAGGDRDPTKRPLLAQAAAAADLAIVTSDNPRTEDPEQIITQICQGFTLAACRYHRITDRRKAIEAAVELAQPGDKILVAGKGHETTQHIGTELHPFDDAAVCRSAIQQRVRRHNDAPVLAGMAQTG